MLGHLRVVAANEVTTKMEGPGQVTTEDLKTKDPKKVEESKRFVEYNHRKREELAKAQKIGSEPNLTSSQYYGAGAVVAIGVLGAFGHCIYQSKKGDVTPVHQLSYVKARVWQHF